MAVTKARSPPPEKVTPTAAASHVPVPLLFDVAVSVSESARVQAGSECSGKVKSCPWLCHALAVKPARATCTCSQIKRRMRARKKGGMLVVSDCVLE
jgi:hypothetical protein